MKKTILIGIVFVLIVPFVLGEQAELGTFKVNEPINLIQTCANCTFVNLSSVTYPNSSYLLRSSEEMTKEGITYNYTISNASAIGTYVYCTYGDPDGVVVAQCVNFEVNRVGFERDSGNFGIGLGIVLIGVTLLFVILAAVTRESRPWSIAFLLFTFFMIIVDFRFASMLSETASLNSNLTDSLNTIYGVFIRVFVFILFLAATYILILVIKSFNKKSKAQMIRDSMDGEFILPR